MIIQPYYRTTETEENSTVFVKKNYEWLPPSYWIEYNLTEDEIKEIDEAQTARNDVANDLMDGKNWEHYI